jgi:hypothetical protein
MNKTRFTRAERIILGGVTLVFAALLTLGMAAYLNRDNRWFPIVHPTDARAVEIVAVTRLLQPYVRTDAGNYYFCSGSTWQDTCRPVAQTDLPVNPIPGRWQTCTPVFPTLPALPGEAVNTLDVGQCQEGRTYARLAVLADGTIWKWQRNFSWVAGFALGSVAVASLLAGALIGLAIVLVRRYLRSPVPEIPPAPKPTRVERRSSAKNWH